MGGEDIETVIVVEVELELGGKVTYGAGHETEEDGGWGTDETRTGRDRDQTGNGTRTETNSRPFTFEAVILCSPRCQYDRYYDETKYGNQD